MGLKRFLKTGVISTDRALEEAFIANASPQCLQNVRNGHAKNSFPGRLEKLTPSFEFPALTCRNQNVLSRKVKHRSARQVPINYRCSLDRYLHIPLVLPYSLDSSISTSLDVFNMPFPSAFCLQIQTMHPCSHTVNHY